MSPESARELIERLRTTENWRGTEVIVLLHDAAAAIERLQAENERLQARVEELEQERGGHAPTCGGMDPAARECECGYLQGEAYRDLRARCAEMERESLEEARLAGAGASREAKLMARVAELERECAIERRERDDARRINRDIISEARKRRADNARLLERVAAVEERATALEELEEWLRGGERRIADLAMDEIYAEGQGMRPACGLDTLDRRILVGGDTFAAAILAAIDKAAQEKA